MAERSEALGRLAPRMSWVRIPHLNGKVKVDPVLGPSNVINPSSNLVLLSEIKFNDFVLLLTITIKFYMDQFHGDYWHCHPHPDENAVQLNDKAEDRNPVAVKDIVSKITTMCVRLSG